MRRGARLEHGALSRDHRGRRCRRLLYVFLAATLAYLVSRGASRCVSVWPQSLLWIHASVLCLSVERHTPHACSQSGLILPEESFLACEMQERTLGQTGLHRHLPPPSALPRLREQVRRPIIYIHGRLLQTSKTLDFDVTRENVGTARHGATPLVSSPADGSAAAAGKASGKEAAICQVQCQI